MSQRDFANLVSTFEGNVLLCLHNHNGNHVIQKAITILSSYAKEAQENGDDELCSFFLQSLEPIIDEIVEEVEHLSKHPYGCRAVQRLVEYCSIEPQKTKVLDSIAACQRDLLEDQYGNYVVQKLLQHGRLSDREAVFQSITANNRVIRFSKQKEASNVVEAMLRLGHASQRERIVQEILQCFCTDQYSQTESAAVSMSKNPYGNYVIKTALDVLEEGELRERLYNELLSNLAELVRSISYLCILLVYLAQSILTACLFIVVYCQILLFTIGEGFICQEDCYPAQDIPAARLNLINCLAPP